jgi:hypothetical protein
MALAAPKQTIALDTFGGCIHAEWDPEAASRRWGSEGVRDFV